ncbi:MAG: DNA mismatch repair endonuclease MutL [Chthoniobacterales bacterium]
MGKIRMLSDILASQVAAGEVVERPASVVKELVENSIDAGARSVVVEFSRGGTASIVISDDGSGMDREDALLCLERHATSKIQKSEDLANVSTLGFRGEALPSIASVSKFRLVTCEHGAASGTEITIQGGRMEGVRDCGQAPGTRIEVGSLFFNIPARRKFLRAESTEGAHIVHQMQILALAKPGIAFACLRDGREVFRVAPAKEVSVRIRELLGAEFLSSLSQPIRESTHDGIKVSGFVGKPGSGRRDRSHQFTFLNGRAITNPAIQSGLREAFYGLLEKGLTPPAVLYIQMDPTRFDCNVHPAKREVRFRSADIVSEAIRQFAALALIPATEPTQVTTVSTKTETEPVPANVPASQDALISAQTGFFVSAAPAGEAGESFADESLPFRPLSLFGSRYFLLEKEGGLVVADLRAATERIIYEKMLRQIEISQPQVQRLLFPALVELQPKDHDWICSKQELLASAGILLESFGAGVVKVEALPDILSGVEPRDVIYEAIDALHAAGSRAQGRLLEDAIARSLSKLVGAHFQRLGMEEAIRILRDLMRCDLPYACPLGRPTLIEWSRSELERKFGRES